MKRCPRCEQTKPAQEFGRNRAQADGLSTYCRPCHNSYSKRWADQNRVKVRTTKRRWVENNPEAMNAARAAWTAENPEWWRERGRRRRREHPEEKRAEEARRRARKKASAVIAFTPSQLEQRLAAYGHRSHRHCTSNSHHRPCKAPECRRSSHPRQHSTGLSYLQYQERCPLAA